MIGIESDGSVKAELTAAMAGGMRAAMARLDQALTTAGF